MSKVCIQPIRKWTAIANALGRALNREVAVQRKSVPRIKNNNLKLTVK